MKDPAINKAVEPVGYTRKTMLWRAIEHYRLTDSTEEHIEQKEVLDNYIDDMLGIVDGDLERRVDGAWAQFCAGIGDSPKAPYPGMICAFESHYGQSFADKDWRNEASVWAAAWKAALANCDDAIAALEGQLK